jgi:hypothetical protein
MHRDMATKKEKAKSPAPALRGRQRERSTSTMADESRKAATTATLPAADPRPAQNIGVRLVPVGQDVGRPDHL